MCRPDLTCSPMLGNVVISLVMLFLEGIEGYIIGALQAAHGQRW